MSSAQSSVRFVPHLGYRSTDEIPEPIPAALREPPISDSLEDSLMTVVAKLAWVIEAQSERINVLEQLVGYRAVQRETMRRQKAQVQS